eukprot:GILJ01004592.1.p1 GENE.GILJ01004592.1~~GILJ01004592.1.p1  ORF type:complete len:1275 (+),score=312.24 GILJ01004592.1:89-3913(+)
MSLWKQFSSITQNVASTLIGSTGEGSEQPSADTDAQGPAPPSVSNEHRLQQQIEQLSHDLTVAKHSCQAAEEEKTKISREFGKLLHEKELENQTLQQKYDSLQQDIISSAPVAGSQVLHDRVAMLEEEVKQANAVLEKKNHALGRWQKRYQQLGLLKSSGEWMECMTEDGHLYYFNNSTGRSSWSKPSEWIDSLEQQGLSKDDALQRQLDMVVAEKEQALQSVLQLQSLVEEERVKATHWPETATSLESLVTMLQNNHEHQQLVNQLQSDLQQKEQELDQLRSQLQTPSASPCKGHEEVIEELRHHVAQLQKERDEAIQHMNEQLNQSAVDFGASEQEWKNRESEVIAERDAARQEVAAIQTQWEQFRHELTRQNLDIQEQLESDLKSVRSELLFTSERLSSRESMLKQLREENQELNQEILTLRNEVGAIRSRRHLENPQDTQDTSSFVPAEDIQSAELHDLNDRIDHYQGQLSELERQLRATEESLQQEKERSDVRATEIQTLAQERDSLMERFAQASAAAADLEARLVNSGDRERQEEEQRQTLQRQHHDAIEALKASEQFVSTLKTEKEHLIARVRDLTDLSEEGHINFQERNKAVQRADELEHLLREQTQRIAHLESACIPMQQEELLQPKSFYLDQVTQLENEKAELQLKLESALNELSQKEVSSGWDAGWGDQEDRSSALEDRIGQLEGELREKQQRCLALERQVQQKSTAVAAVQDELQRASEGPGSHEISTHAAQDAIQYQRRIHELEQVVDQGKVQIRQLEEMVEEEKMELQDTVEEYRRKHSSLEEELRATLEHMRGAKEALAAGQQRVVELEQELAQKELLLRQTHAQLTELRAMATQNSDPQLRVAELIEERESALKRVEQLQGELAGHVASSESLQHEVKSAQDRLAEKELQVNQLLDSNEQLQQRTSSLDAELVNLRSQLTQVTSEHSILQQSLTDKERELQSALSQRESVNSISSQLKLELNRMREELSSLEAERDELLGQVDLTVELKQTNSQLQAQLQATTAETDHVRASERELNQTVNSLQSEVHSLSSQLEDTKQQLASLMSAKSALTLELESLRRAMSAIREQPTEVHRAPSPQPIKPPLLQPLEIVVPTVISSVTSAALDLAEGWDVDAWGGDSSIEPSVSAQQVGSSELPVVSTPPPAAAKELQTVAAVSSVRDITPAAPSPLRVPAVESKSDSTPPPAAAFSSPIPQVKAAPVPSLVQASTGSGLKIGKFLLPKKEPSAADLNLEEILGAPAPAARKPLVIGGRAFPPKQ